MNKKLSFAVREKIIQLAGKCFWYWNGFYRFLDACGIPKAEVERRFPRESFNKYQIMANVLDELEQKNRQDVIKVIVSEFYKMTKAADADVNPKAKDAEKALKEFQSLVGTDPIEAEIQKREHEKNIQERREQQKITQNKSQEEDKLKNTFLELTKSNDRLQRGFQLEKLFFDLLDFEEVENVRPYRPEGEQIDGHFKFEKFDYLVEIKWEKDAVAQSDLSVFDGKIRGKAQSTRGLFVSVSGFGANAIAKFSGDSPRILLMDGLDLMVVLERRLTFLDAMKFKVDRLVRYGEIFKHIS